MWDFEWPKCDSGHRSFACVCTLTATIGWMALSCSIICCWDISAIFLQAAKVWKYCTVWTHQFKGGFRGGDKGAMAPKDANHCATWHWNNTMLLCTAIKNASNYAFYFHLALNFRLCTLKNAPACGGLRPPGPLPELRLWTPLLNRWIIHLQQTMNQDNKISSVRPGTINIELGL